MALIKVKTLPTGFTAEYWRLINASVTINGGAYVTAQIALYKDKAQFLAGGSAIDIQSFQITTKIPSAMAKSFKDWMYSQVKAGNFQISEDGINWFSDSVDEVD